MSRIILLACENCRRRKVRCSGTPTSACVNCVKQKAVCQFDLNRRRRGPRPKRINVEQESRFSRVACPVTGLTSAPTSPSEPFPELRDVFLAQDIQDQMVQIDYSFNSDTMATWRARLVDLLGGESYYLNGERLTSVDQTWHLILIFCVTVNSQQCPVLAPTAFLHQLENGRVTRQLCHAMCAASISYSRHASCTEPAARIAFASDAREHLLSSQPVDSHATYQQLLTLSVLSLYETSQGNGAQAWYDLTTAIGILASLRHTTSVSQDDDMQNGLEIIHLYLRVALICFSIGPSMQSIHIDSMGLPRSDDDVYPIVESSSVPQILLRLSGLLHRCITFSRKNLTKLVPAPWARDSSYMALKRELDMVHILYGGNSALETETLEMLQRQEIGAGYYVLCMSMLHAMRMLLDAVFLPIPVIPAAGFEYSATDDGCSDTASGTSCPRKSLYFPAAPRSFRCERTASCMRSARAVTSLCESLMDHFDFAMPPFLGYALFLAGLIFLNQLHAETDTRRLDDCVAHLKTIFSFLGAMRSFFVPAQVWLHVLFQVHGLDPTSETKALARDSTKLFSSFMHRFDGISAPAYCPIAIHDMTVLRQQSEATDVERLSGGPDNYNW
ncbi:hypothetical protein F4779DRAFT_629733 [Xylariaceae sp. FL0662B]|nr:hypothetical protein F4779DRAFT_629733 [Xylariaceae sp. FL0662B]